MTKQEFSWIISDLEDWFEPLDDSKVNKLYSRFKDTNKDIFKKAIDILLDVHPHKRFPLPSEIKNAIKQASEQVDYATPKDLENLEACEHCKGTGFLLVDVPSSLGSRTYTFAKFCTCNKGKLLEKNREDYLKKRKLSGKEKEKSK